MSGLSGLLSRLATLSIARALIVGLVLAALYYLAAFDDGSRLDKTIDAKRTEVETARVLLNKAKAAAENTKKFEEEVASIEKQLSDVSRYLPAELTVSELRQSLMEQAQAAGTEVISIRQAGENGKMSFYEMLRFEVNLRGNYAQHAKFLSNLSKLPRVFTFDQLSLTVAKSPGGQSTLDFRGLMVAYKYLPGSQPPAGGQ